MGKRYSVRDGYSVADFLHYGFDNVAAATLLLKANARYFDSGGYLAQLGIELLLKAWQLHVFGDFEEGHRLVDLWERLRQHDQTLILDERGLETLHKIDSYYVLRYPNPTMPHEIGDEGLSDLLALETALGSQMPLEMHKIVEGLSPVRKGGRVLMERPL